MLWFRALVLLPLAVLARSEEVGPRIGDSLDAARVEAVKKMFTFAWDGYYEHAFPMDMLQPVSNTGFSPINGWGASAVDALDTAIIMGFDSVVDQILNYIPKIDFTKSFENSPVSLFETTIRYLGGMLSAYELLTGEYYDPNRDLIKVDALLQQSRKLADILSFAFDTKTGIPFNMLDMEKRTNALIGSEKEDITSLAVAGSLIFEWQRLSDITGEPRYGKLAEKAESYLLAPKPPSGEPFPGLVGQKINITTGLFIDSSGGWDGSSDSFYEYLLKMWIYDRDRFDIYKNRWILAVEETYENLFYNPKGIPDVTFISMFNGTKQLQQWGHLSCFAGGNFILGGMVLHQQRYIDYGLAITNGCRYLYSTTETKIGAEFVKWNSSTVPEDQKDFFDKNGYYIDNPEYILRPEYIESLYYAWRVTGNQTYKEWAWQAVVAINQTTRVGSGFSAVWKVNEPNGGSFEDKQESFIFAEFFKYAYLIFTEDCPIHVTNSSEQVWVFTTEAHPFKVQHGPILAKPRTREQRVFNGSPLYG